MADNLLTVHPTNRRLSSQRAQDIQTGVTAMYEGIAQLLSEPLATYDADGNEHIDYTRQTVYVTPRSVYASEFYSAAQLGIHPSIVLTIANRADYGDQKMIEYEGKEYLVLMPMEEEDGEVVILEVEPVDEENENYLAVDNEETLEAVFAIFKERYQDILTFEE